MQDQNQLVHPGQHQSQHIAQYATQQPPQQSLENPIHQSFEDLEEDPDEGSNEGSDEDPDEDPIEYSDGDTDEDVEEDIYEEDIDEGSDEGSDHHQVDDSIEQSFEDPDLYPYGVSDAQQAHSGYQTVATAPVTRAFRSLGLTSSDAQPGPSRPGATSQAAGTWARNLGNPALPDPMPNPFGSNEQPVTGYEQSAPETESILNRDQEWYVRMSLAYDAHIDGIAVRMELPVQLVRNFVLAKNLAWTPQQDVRLLAMVDQGLTMYVILERLNSLPGGPIRVDHEVNSRVSWLRSDRSARQVELAGNPQNDPEQYPMVSQPGEPLPPQADQEVAAETTPALGRITHWNREETRKLREWVAQHEKSSGDMWENVENEFPGRTKVACKRKWYILSKDSLESDSGHYPQDLSLTDLNFLKDQNAKGIPVRKLIADHYPDHDEWVVMDRLRSTGWSRWTRQEDEQVRGLQREEGDEWAQINSPAGKSRSRQEVINRYELLTSGQRNKQTRKKPFRWTETINTQLGRKLAQGMTYANVANAGFYGLKGTSIRSHAAHIRINWTNEDDAKLRGMNLEPDANFDWVSVGRLFKPWREGEAVKIRWEALHGRKVSQDAATGGEV